MDLDWTAIAIGALAVAILFNGIIALRGNNGCHPIMESIAQRFRSTAVVFAVVLLVIVWMSYHYTGQMMLAGIEAIQTAESAVEVKDGIIQLMAGVTGNMVAIAVVGGLASAVNKLCEE